MCEPRRCASFALKSSTDDPFARNDLDGNLAVEALVSGLPDRPETSRPQPSMQPIAIEHDRQIPV
jgi:hypothetical protein